MGFPAGWLSSVPGVTATEAAEIYGNAVVPQAAAIALDRLMRIILTIESEESF